MGALLFPYPLWKFSCEAPLAVTWPSTLTIWRSFQSDMSRFTAILLGTTRDFQNITPLVNGSPVTRPSPKNHGKTFKRTRSRTFPIRLISRHNPAHFPSWPVARVQSIVPVVSQHVQHLSGSDAGQLIVRLDDAIISRRVFLLTFN